MCHLLQLSVLSFMHVLINDTLWTHWQSFPNICTCFNNLLKIRTLRQRKAHRGLTMTTGDKFTMSEWNFFSPTAFFIRDSVTPFSNNATPPSQLCKDYRDWLINLSFMQVRKFKMTSKKMNFSGLLSVVDICILIWLTFSVISIDECDKLETIPLA